MNRPSLWAIVVALIPFCAMCFSVSAWDRIYPMVLGLPFNFFWLLSWIVLTPLCLRIAYHLEALRNTDQTRSRRHEQASR